MGGGLGIVVTALARRIPPRTTATAAGVVLFVGAALALLLRPVPAFAWDVMKSSNGCILQRESGDATSNVTAQVFYDYKGGNTWTSAYRFGSVSSYNASATIGTIGGSDESLEVPLIDGYRCQLVYLSSGKYFGVLNEPVKVTAENTRSVPVTVTGDVGQSDQSNLLAWGFGVVGLGVMFVAGVKAVR